MSNDYKQFILNTSEEIPYTRIPNTILCTDVIKLGKSNLSRYPDQFNPNQSPLKVVYHDKYFKENISQINSFDHLVEILNNEEILNLNNNENYLSYNYINSKNIIFDSNFESGNLHMAIELDELDEYDLILRKEFGSNKTYQWFFFSVIIFQEDNNNINSNNNIIKFNIINMAKDKSTFNSQCPVLIFDTKLNKWSRNTFNVFSYNNGIKKEKLKNEYQAYYTLTFSFSFQYNTKYYFSYCYPYTYTQLKLYLNTLNNPIYSNYIKFGKVGLSNNNNIIPYLIITDFSILESKKKCIFLTARIHPGETPGSYAIQGCINFLVNPNNKIAENLRKKFIFKIIPMINVDGVIYGNYRCNIKGKDLNRMWISPTTSYCREVYEIKRLLKLTCMHREIYFFCDFHGHSTKSNFFIFGCEKKNSPGFEKVFMKIFEKINNNFEINYCVNKISQSKIRTGRAIVKNEFKVDLSYCLESSMNSYYNTNSKNKKNVFPFSMERYKKVGNDFCIALNELIDKDNFNKVLTDIKNNMNSLLNSNSSLISKDKKEKDKENNNYENYQII